MVTGSLSNCMQVISAAFSMSIIAIKLGFWRLDVVKLVLYPTLHTGVTEVLEPSRTLNAQTYVVSFVPNTSWAHAMANIKDEMEFLHLLCSKKRLKSRLGNSLRSHDEPSCPSIVSSNRIWTGVLPEQDQFTLAFVLHTILCIRHYEKIKLNATLKI